MMTPEQLAASGTEHGHQAALFCWSALPEIRDKYPVLKYMFAVPNGFFSSAAQKGKMKAEGLKDGVLDIWLPYRVQLWVGLVIELKIPARRHHKDGGCSEEQLDWIAFLKTQGYKVWVCYGWEEARQKIDEYLK